MQVGHSEVKGKSARPRNAKAKFLERIRERRNDSIAQFSAKITRNA
jgi:hypothetical protein